MAKKPARGRKSATTSKAKPAQATKAKAKSRSTKSTASSRVVGHPASSPRTGTIYSVHPGVVMVQTWVATLPEKTGRSLEQWIELVKREGPPTEAERRDWLKTKHKMGTNGAWWIAERAEGGGQEDTDPEAYLRAAVQWVEAMFSGPKAALRPIYDELIRLGKSLGDDVRICPCKTIVPFYRRYVFAQIKPSTRTRIDLGFSLRDTRATGRLIDTGGQAKGDRITHAIAISTPEEIDDEVKRWLREAYHRDQ